MLKFDKGIRCVECNQNTKEAKETYKLCIIHVPWTQKITATSQTFNIFKKYLNQ